MSQIYISYNHNDRELVHFLSRHLKDLGHETFYADATITAGQDWRSSLADVLKNADAALFIITPSSIESRWVLAESGSALAYAQERGRPIVIPVAVDGAEIPGPLQHIQAIFGSSSNPGDIALHVSLALDALLGRQLAAEEERQEVRARVETSAASYIRDSLDELKAREKSMRRTANVWYVVGFISLAASVGVAIWRANHAIDVQPNWQSVIQFSIFGVAIILLLVALAKYSFLLGKSHMVEALRNSDRSHAISFGEFYLKAFADKTEWKEVKEALQHWNIDKGSDFLSQDVKHFDPEILATAIEIAKVMAKKDEGKEKPKKD